MKDTPEYMYVNIVYGPSLLVDICAPPTEMKTPPLINWGTLCAPIN